MQFEAGGLASGIIEVQLNMEVGFRCHTRFDVSIFCEILTGLEQAADQGLSTGVQQDDFQPGECQGTACAVDDGQAQAQGIRPGGVVAHVTAEHFNLVRIAVEFTRRRLPQSSFDQHVPDNGGIRQRLLEEFCEIERHEDEQGNRSSDPCSPQHQFSVPGPLIFSTWLVRKRRVFRRR